MYRFRSNPTREFTTYSDRLLGSQAKSVFRKPNGQWFLLANSPRATSSASFGFESKTSFENGDDYPLVVSVETFIDRLVQCARIDDPTSEERLWSPSLWTPEAQDAQRVILADSVSDILRAIRSEKVSLAELPWRTLEEIVAEVLRRSGLEIHVVKERPQGGRDIVARGQLIPGQEPFQMAIEVKQMKVVDRPEVQKALWQNRAYPALLLATSGRFTSGVFQEKQLPENRLRLFLKDGVALGDLVRDYLHE